MNYNWFWGIYIFVSICFGLANAIKIAEEYGTTLDVIAGFVLNTIFAPIVILIALFKKIF